MLIRPAANSLSYTPWPRSIFAPGDEGLVLGWPTLKSNRNLYTTSALSTLSQLFDPVGGVVDLSGNGNNLTQATAGSRATLGQMPVSGVRNLLDSSNDLRNWNLVNTTAPTASLLRAAASTSSHHAEKVQASINGATYTVTARVSRGTWDYVQLAVSNNANPFATFDLSDGTPGSSGGVVSCSIEEVSDGLYDITMTFVSSGTTNYARIDLAASKTATRGQAWTAVGTETINVFATQMEFGSVFTGFQTRVAAFNITEAGIPSQSILYFDALDDSLSTTLPAGTYYVAAAGDKGVFFDTITHAGGTWTYGPTTYTGGAAGRITGTIGRRLIGLLLIDRALTAAEQARLVQIATAAGAGPLVP